MPDELIQVLATGDAVVWRTLLADHVSDLTGRCRLCQVGNGCGRHLWPCRLHLLAAAARDTVRAARGCPDAAT